MINSAGGISVLPPISFSKGHLSQAVCIVTSLYAATNDVQSANVVANGPGAIRVTAGFVANTTANGCFVVLQSKKGSPDVFRALLLPDTHGTTVNSTINDIPPSDYTFLIYDLEEDALPNRSPAYQNQDNSVTVIDSGKVLFDNSTKF